MDMIHDEDYQKKLFSAAQNYMGKKQKQDLMDNIRRFNWKVQNGQKSSRIKVYAASKSFIKISLGE